MSQSDSPSLSETAAIAPLLNIGVADLQSALSDARDEMEKRGDRAKPGDETDAAYWYEGAEIIGAIHAAMPAVLASLSGPSLTEASDSGTTKTAPSIETAASVDHERETPPAPPSDIVRDDDSPITAADVLIVARLMEKYRREAIEAKRGVMLSWENASGFALTLHAAAQRIEEQDRSLGMYSAEAIRNTPDMDDLETFLRSFYRADGEREGWDDFSTESQDRLRGESARGLAAVFARRASLAGSPSQQTPGVQWETRDSGIYEPEEIRAEFLSHLHCRPASDSVSETTAPSETPNG